MEDYKIDTINAEDYRRDVPYSVYRDMAIRLPKHYKIQVQQIGRVVRSGESKVFNQLRKDANDI